jgi:site-specific DNA-methyltransferase (adenine-specific)
MACWTKPYPPPAAPGNWWPSAFELAVYGYRPGAYFGDDDPARSNVFRYDALRNGNGEKNGHPTQKPIALMQRIANAITRPGAAIIDPFMGSGTTGVAALRLGRKFTGIEIDERWFDIACRRIEAEARQGRIDFDPVADGIGSHNAALTEIGRRVAAGEEDIPTSGYFAGRTSGAAK